MRSQLAWLISIALLTGCGGPLQADAGTDAGAPRDAGVMTRVDAGTDAGPQPFDAGPPPPRYVFGNMTVNGVQHELESGFVAVSPGALQFRLSTNDMVTPRLMLVLVLPGDAGAGFSAPCGPTVVFSAQHLADAGTAYFTRNVTCMVALTEAATAVEMDGGPDASTYFVFEGEYAGTVTGSANFDPRSAWDAGYSTFNLTAGSFRVVRTF